VISNDNIEGFVVLTKDISQSVLSLGFGVADLVIDDPELRRLKGPDFTKHVSDKDRNASRANMLGSELLRAQQFPQILIRSDSLKGSLPQFEVEATVAIRGMEYSLVFPATVAIMDDSVVASGEIEIRHADIGLAPFTAFLGLIRIRDEIVLQYHIQADRILPQAN
jgi:polyisoprenoid-binding protein YceI